MPSPQDLEYPAYSYAYAVAYSSALSDAESSHSLPEPTQFQIELQSFSFRMIAKPLLTISGISWRETKILESWSPVG